MKQCLNLLVSAGGDTGSDTGSGEPQSSSPYAKPSTSLSSSSLTNNLKSSQIVQSVKAICALLGQIEMLEVEEVCNKLVRLCQVLETKRSDSIGGGNIIRPKILDQVRKPTHI